MGPTSEMRGQVRPTFGIEIGGRGQRAVLIGEEGRILDSTHSIDRGSSAPAIVETACLLIEQIIARRNLSTTSLQGIGIAFGGPVDAERGITIRSHRTNGFEQFPLASLIEERFGVRTVLENDARAAALGEFTFGAGRGSRNMVYLHLGSGVGGGIIVDGRLHHGVSMTSGELGHMVVTTNGPRCSCGKPGHLEAYASEGAIVERMRLQLAATSPETKANWLAQHGVTVKRIFDAYETDASAKAVVDETIQVIGLAIANLVTALNPDAVILGGHVTEAAMGLPGMVRAKIRQYGFDAAARHVAVASAQLGADSGVIGAAVLASRAS